MKKQGLKQGNVGLLKKMLDDYLNSKNIWDALTCHLHFLVCHYILIKKFKQS